jgi:toxin ParE1/3/4
MNGYRLPQTAQEDITAIRDYYLEVAGRKVARLMLVEFVEAFRFLAHNPGAGHKREDLAEDRAVLFWPKRDCLIVYRPGPHPLEIVTIARGSQDVQRIIGRRGL